MEILQKKRMCFKNTLRRSPTIHIIYECCEKIDLFRVQNRVVHILPWWECIMVSNVLLLLAACVSLTEKFQDHWFLHRRCLHR